MSIQHRGNQPISIDQTLHHSLLNALYSNMNNHYYGFEWKKNRFYKLTFGFFIWYFIELHERCWNLTKRRKYRFFHQNYGFLCCCCCGGGRGSSCCSCHWRIAQLISGMKMAKLFIHSIKSFCFCIPFFFVYFRNELQSMFNNACDFYSHFLTRIELSSTASICRFAEYAFSK